MFMGNLIGNSENKNKGLLEVPFLEEIVDFSNIVTFKGITFSFFKNLNSTYAKLLSGKIERRVLDLKGDYKKDKNGKHILEDVKIPSGSVAISSAVNLGLPFKHIYPKGFLYVDFLDIGGSISYIYIIPKQFVYMVPKVGLVLTKGKVSAYRSIRVKLSAYEKFYLSIVPIKSNKQPNNMVVIATQYYAYKFNSEIENLFQYWNQLGILVGAEETERTILTYAKEDIPLSKPSIYNLEN